MISNEIRYFLAVANTGSLSAASEQLFIAVSAISRQIQRLETQWAFRCLNVTLAGWY